MIQQIKQHQMMINLMIMVCKYVLCRYMYDTDICIIYTDYPSNQVEGLNCEQPIVDKYVSMLPSDLNELQRKICLIVAAKGTIKQKDLLNIIKPETVKEIKNAIHGLVDCGLLVYHKKNNETFYSQN